MTLSAQPQVAPAEVGARVLRYLAQIHSDADLSPDRIETLTGLPIRFDPEDANRYGFGTALDDGWACGLSSIPDRRGGPPKRLVFSYDDLRQRPQATVPSAAPEFDDFARSLRDAGYQEELVHGPRGAIWGHRFVRDGVALDVRTEREDPMAEAIRFRVSHVVVKADAPEVSRG